MKMCNIPPLPDKGGEKAATIVTFKEFSYIYEKRPYFK